MQDGWQRRQAHLALDTAELAELLAPAFPGRAVLAASPLAGGLVNTNYRVTVAGRAADIVVRVYTRDPAACQIEYDVLRRVLGNVPAPEVLYADLAGERGGRPYLILTFIEGTKLTDILAAGDPTECAAAGRAAGRGLAAIHQFTFPAAGFFGPGLAVTAPLDVSPDGYRGYIAAFLAGLAGERLGATDATALARLAAEQAELVVWDGAPALIHADYKPQNLLVRRAGPGWALAAALDWEFAFAGAPLFDLGTLLRYRAQVPAGYVAAVVAGYREAGGILPSAWPRITRLLDLLNLLTFLAEPDADDRQIAEVRALVRATLTSWDATAEGA